MPDEVKPLTLKNSLTITFSDRELELLCPQRRSTWKSLRQQFVELQSYWVEKGFSTTDLLLDDDCWERMKAIAQLFPQADNPTVYGFDLEPLDIEQLEQLFFTQDKSEISAYHSDNDLLILNVFIDVFKGCKILEFCRFEPRLILQEAHALWKDRRDAPAAEADDSQPESEPATKSKRTAKVA